jgi:tRNA pseudouridine55 synthase
MARGNRKGRPINGWLIIDKDAGITSTRVVAMVKRLTQARKAGHGGTLDPLATGVLPIALGEATKTVPYLMDSRKAYRFTLRLGEARDTDDADGEVTARSDLRPDDTAVLAALPSFTGLIQQRPPSYAAVKVRGERAYHLARRGEAVALEPREVRIDELRFVERPDPDHLVLEMTCGKGAYVRAVARDLGERLGCLAHVTRLRRTAVGPFGLDRATKLAALEQIVADDSLPQVLVPVATALAGIPALAVTEPQAFRLLAGQPIVVSPQLVTGPANEGATIKVLRGGALVALGRLEGPELVPLRVFHLRADAATE